MRRLTIGRSFDLYPAWSPNGKQIAYASSRDITGGRISEIYVMSADGSSQRRLTKNLVDDWLPTWSPDGKMIAFTRDVNDKNNELFRMDADGKNQERLTSSPGNDIFPAWRPG